jgi:hypothetical protein
LSLAFGATGIGSMPGTDPGEAVRMVLGLLPELPFLPELPARGQHGDLAGRSAALLADLPVDLQPAGWRLTSGRSRDGARARDLLSYDLDALQEAAQEPPALKLQCAGPWTLAALLELPKGDRVLADPAAVDDLAQSLAEGLLRQLQDLHARLPDTRLVLQLDEPSLPAVLAGRVRTASGFGTLRAPAASRAVEVLRSVLRRCEPVVGEATVVHCCASAPPLAVLARAGAGALSLDATRLTPRDDDALGEAVEGGAGLLLGVVPSLDADLSDLGATMAPVVALWQRLGFGGGGARRTVVVTPTCGWPAPRPGHARRALQACGEIARRLGEAPSDGSRTAARTPRRTWTASRSMRSSGTASCPAAWTRDAFATTCWTPRPRATPTTTPGWPSCARWRRRTPRCGPRTRRRSGSWAPSRPTSPRSTTSSG